MIGLFQKNSNRGKLGHTFLKKNMDLDLLALPLYPWKFWTKKAFFTFRNSVKLCYPPWKCWGHKSRLMKIQQSFSFTLENSVELCKTLWSPLEIALLFQLNLRTSTCNFFNTPGNFMSSTPSCLDFSLYIYSIYI